MAMRIEMGRVGEMVDAYSGICFADTTQTIINALSKSQLERYTNAIEKVNAGKGLNLKDLAVLDAIDAITYEHHGMCLKDSKVTKARIKATKKFHLKFTDRDGLIEHMNMMMSDQNTQNGLKQFYKELNEFFIESLGADMQKKLLKIISKLDNSEYFDLADLQFLSKMESVSKTELGLTIVNKEIKAAIDRSCKKLGVYFQNLQEAVLH